MVRGGDAGLASGWHMKPSASADRPVPVSTRCGASRSAGTPWRGWTACPLGLVRKRGELLHEGAAALGQGSLPRIAHSGTGHADQAEPASLEKAPVLGGQRHTDQVRYTPRPAARRCAARRMMQAGAGSIKYHHDLGRSRPCAAAPRCWASRQRLRGRCSHGVGAIPKHRMRRAGAHASAGRWQHTAGKQGQGSG